jgi:hypothetical protein
MNSVRGLLLFWLGACLACGSTPTTKSSSSTTNAGTNSGSNGNGNGTNANGSGANSGSNGTTGNPTSNTTGANSNGPTGSSSGTHGATTNGTQGTSGQCVPDGVFVGEGNASECCSLSTDGNGYCGAATNTTGGNGTTGTNATNGTTGVNGTSGTTSTSGVVCGGATDCVVYAHTGGDLYQVDPTSLQVSHLCSFSGLNGDAYDLAVRSDGTLFVVTGGSPAAIYKVNPTTCASGHVVDLPSGLNFNSLTFTTNGELLSASATGEVDSLDLTTGAVTQVGSYGTGLGSSGDLVVVYDPNTAQDLIYATVVGITNGDMLIRVDPNNNFTGTIIGNIGYSEIYGLGYWAGTLYGFDSSGDVLQIDPNTAAATLLTNDGNDWYGAGTTPHAPVFR